MAGWKLRVKRLFSLSFLVIFILQFLTPFGLNSFNVTPVLAAEEEEEDGFRQMPNYRWRNISTTSGTVTERLIEDIYEISSINNPSGSATFRKGRELNSRDFYFNSRFALDIGGSTVEAFTDEREDACDFEEDNENAQTYSGGSISTSIVGMLSVWRNTPDNQWGFEFPNMFGTLIFPSSYRYLEFRIKGTGASQYDLRLSWDFDSTSIPLIDDEIPTEWTEYRIDLWNYPLWTNKASRLDRHQYICSTDSTGSYYLDYIRFIGVMDYPAFYQGEIEDPWDFNEFADTSEYWNNIYGNVSDFNDGSLEVWNPDSASLSNYNNNWLNVTQTIPKHPEFPPNDYIYYLNFNDYTEGTGDVFDHSRYDLDVTENWGYGHYSDFTYNEDANGSMISNDTYHIVESSEFNYDWCPDFTLGFWIYIDNITETQDNVIDKDGAYQCYIRNYSLTQYQYKFIFRTALGGETSSNYFSNENITEDTWYFVAFSYDNTTEEGKIYINGTLDSTTSGGYWNDYPPLTEDVYIGGYYGYLGYYLDDVFFLNHTSDLTDIQWFWNNLPNVPTEEAPSQYTSSIKSDVFNPAINRDLYNYLNFEINNIRGKIKEIRIYNSTDSLMFNIEQDINQGEEVEFFLEGSDLWVGTSLITDYLKFEVDYYTESNIYISQYHLNYTYLRSGGTSYDDWGNVDGIFIESKKVYFLGNSTEDFELLTLRNIPSEYFENFKIRLKGLEDGKFQVKAYDGSQWVNMTSMIDFTTEWDIYEESFRYLDAWKDVANQRKLGIQFYNSSGLPIDDEFLIGVDYIQLLGHFDEEEGFKFAIYDENDLEGMYWKFTRQGAGENETYVVTIEMLDHTGIALSYEESFQYDMYDDGWLRLDVEFHLDKKKMKMELEYENGTDIIKTRSISYLYPKIPTQLRLILLDEGMPSLVMDNTVSGFCKSIVWIDYIDANWMLNQWRDEPTHTIWPNGYPSWYASGYPYQNSTNDFDAISPYLMSMFQTSTTGIGHFYWLNIDRFDGLKFDLRFEVDGWDGNDEYDYVEFNVDMYEVENDGSLHAVVNSEYRKYKSSSSFWIDYVYHNDGQTGARKSHHIDSGASNYMDISYSFFRESEDTLILQDTFDNGNSQAQDDLTFRKSGDWGQEFICFFYYYVKTSNGGAANDRVKIEVRGFDVQRKDILGAIVAAVIAPILWVLSIILAPIIFILQALMLVLTRLFGILLSGLLTGLTPILAGIITTLGIFLDPIMSFIEEILSLITEFGPLLLEIFLAAIEEYIAFLEEFYGLVIDAIILPFLFNLFDSLGLLPLLEFVLQFIGDLMAIIGDVLTLVGLFFQYLFSAAIFWLDAGKLGALALWIIFFVVVYVFTPIISLWSKDFDRLTLEDITDAFSVMFERAFGLFTFAFNFTTYLFSFIFDVLKTIGNYIPFT